MHDESIINSSRATSLQAGNCVDLVESLSRLVEAYHSEAFRAQQRNTEEESRHVMTACRPAGNFLYTAVLAETQSTIQDLRQSELLFHKLG